MQFSTNSDEAIRALIRACPTPIGQYRQAMIQARDRAMALQQFEFGKKRKERQIAIMEAEREQILSSAATGVAEAQIRANRAALIELDIQEASFELSSTEQLVGDAQRELRVCHSEIDRIQRDTGIRFDLLSESEFQGLMTEDFQQKRLRWIASRTLAAQMGIPAEAAEAFLEIPVNERLDYFRKHADLLTEFNQTLDQFVQERKLLNVASN